MPKILLYAEGVTDRGRAVYATGKYEYRDGVLQVLIRKIAADIPISFVVITREDLQRFTLTKYASRELKLAGIARREGCEYIAYHQDEDHQGFDVIYDKVHSYFSKAEEKGIRCLAIVPMHMTESWLLSDRNAFPKVPSSPKLPNKPEETWGKKDDPSHPKRYLELVLRQFDEQANEVSYKEIAQKSDISVLKVRCPVSFGKFYEDMRVFLLQ
jgi:hypothetical protein